jgi:hypothetical protein
MSMGRRLRERMAAAGLVQVMSAHSPLSALLAEEAGFDGIWASGFELSALYGLPDVSLISMTQHLEMVRAIAAILGLDERRVSVKATTTEGLGFTGRGEGIAASAVATLRLPA